MEVQGCWVGMAMVVQWLLSRVCMGGSCLGMSRDNSTRSQNHDLSASLGQSESSCTFEIEVFVQAWAVGRWEEKRRQPGFPMGC